MRVNPVVVPVDSVTYHDAELHSRTTVIPSCRINIVLLTHMQVNGNKHECVGYNKLEC